MIKTNTNSKKGFTIIEVVLVLAIAGLIFLMVFLALPAMQASQRDTERRNALSLFASQLTQYSANNRGKVPSTDAEWESFMKAYLVKPKTAGAKAKAVMNGESSLGYEFDASDSEFVDPDGTSYGWKFVKELGSNSDAVTVKATSIDHIIYIYSNATCDGEMIVPSTGKRKIAFQYKLEGAGVYCGHN